MHKPTRALVDTYAGFAVEDLSLRGMMRTRMAGSLADAGLGGCSCERSATRPIGQGDRGVSTVGSGASDPPWSPVLPTGAGLPARLDWTGSVPAGRHPSAAPGPGPLAPPEDPWPRE